MKIPEKTTAQDAIAKAGGAGAVAGVVVVGAGDRALVGQTQDQVEEAVEGEGGEEEEEAGACLAAVGGQGGGGEGGEGGGGRY